MSDKPNVGDLIYKNNAAYIITDVMPRLTPFKHKNQDTKIEGYTLGLRLATPFESSLRHFS